MEIYGETGYVVAPDGATLKTRIVDAGKEQVVSLPPRPAPFDEPFAYLAAVARGEVMLRDDDLAGLDNNLMVVRILDAAKRSAGDGRSVRLSEGA